MDDAYKIAEYDKLAEENRKLKEQLDKATAERDTYKADNNIFKNTIKEKDKHYLEILKAKNAYIKELEEENSDLKNKQISLEAL